MEVELPIKRRAGKKLSSGSPNDEALDKPFVKTASCNCQEAHEGRPEGVKVGCGAFGRLDVGRTDAQADLCSQGGKVKVEGGRLPASTTDLEWERRADEREITALTRARTAAEKWTATLTSLTGVFSIVALIKGPEEIAEVKGSWWVAAYETWVLVLIGLAVLLAAAGIIASAVAAYGIPRRFIGLGAILRMQERRDASWARRLLGASILASVAAVLCLASAIGITWRNTPDATAPTPRVLVVRSSGATVCGVLEAPVAGETRLLLRPKGTTPATPIPISEVHALQPAATCPGD